MLRISAILLLILSAAALPRISAQDASKPGDLVPNFELRTLGLAGEKSLADYRGKVLFACTYEHVATGMDAARHAMRLESKYGKKGLEVMIISRPDWASIDGAMDRAFIAKSMRGFHGVVSPPLRVPIEQSGEHPLFFVIGPDGTLALRGNYKAQASQIEKAIKKELARRKKGWGKTKLRRRVRQIAYVKGRFNEAWTAIGSEKDEELRNEIQNYVRNRARMVQALIDEGCYTAAALELELLETAAPSPQLFREEAERVRQSLDAISPDARKEDRGVYKIEAHVRRGKVSKAMASKLETLAKKSKDKALAARAEILSKQIRAML